MCFCTEDNQVNARNIAIFQMVFSIIALPVWIMAFPHLLVPKPPTRHITPLDLDVVFWAIIVGGILQFAVSGVLLYGVQKGKAAFCKVWIVAMAIGQGAQSLEIWAFIDGGYFRPMGCAVLYMALNIYFIKVVHTYINYLKTGRGAGEGGPGRGGMVERGIMSDDSFTPV